MHRLGTTLLVVACLLLAGCSGGGGDATTTPDGTTTPDADIERATATATTAGTAVALERRAHPDPPQNLTDASATETAIAAEKARVVNELRNETTVTYFEFGYTQESQARVRNHSDGGVYVAVQVRYSYATEEKSVDGVPSRALYFVNESVVRRVRGLD